MTILHYIPSLDRTSGGTAAYMHLLAAELGKRTDLHIATHPSDHPVPIVNAAIHDISSSMLGGMKREWHRLLEQIRPNVVHVNGCWMPQCALAQRWAQQAGCKVVLTPHGMLEPWIMARHVGTMDHGTALPDAQDAGSLAVSEAGSHAGGLPACHGGKREGQSAETWI